MMNRELLGPSLFLALFTLYAIVAWQIPLLPFEEYETVTSATFWHCGVLAFYRFYFA